MRRSRNSPTLYELMGQSPTVGPSLPRAPIPTSPSDRAPDHASHAGPGWLSPGRLVRIPVGYLFFAAALVLGLLVMSYVVGYKKRDAEVLAERQREAQRALSGVTDPLSQIPLNPDLLQSPSPGAQNASRGTSAAPAGQSAPRAPAGSPLVVRVDSPEQDPRQPGLNYLIVAFLPERESLRAAEFLASKGLEVGVVPVDNRPDWRWVVDLRGVAASDLGGPAADRVRQQVTALGREYKRQERGQVDFSDAYWKRHSR